MLFRCRAKKDHQRGRTPWTMRTTRDLIIVSFSSFDFIIKNTRDVKKKTSDKEYVQCYRKSCGVPARAASEFDSAFPLATRV